jgi:hypothetical protein
VSNESRARVPRLHRGVSRQGQRASVARPRDRERGVGWLVPACRGCKVRSVIILFAQQCTTRTPRGRGCTRLVRPWPRIRAAALLLLALDRVAVAHGTRLARTQQGAWHAWCRYADTWQSCCSLRDDVTIASTGVMNVSSFPGWFRTFPFFRCGANQVFPSTRLYGS